MTLLFVYYWSTYLDFLSHEFDKYLFYDITADNITWSRSDASINKPLMKQSRLRKFNTSQARVC